MKIALIGNCQVRSYERLLNDSLNSPLIRVLDFATPESREEGFRKNFAHGIESFDYILVQNNGLSFTNPDEMRALVNQGCQVVRICNFYFRGLHPDLCYLGKFGRRLGWNHYNSKMCLEGFKNGLDSDAVVTQLMCGLVDDKSILNAWSDSLLELSERDRSCDFPGSPLVDASCKLYPAFHTINHPSFRLLQDYLYSVLDGLGVEYRRNLYSATGDPLSFLQYPVYDFWAELNSLPYRTTQYICIHQRFFSLSEFFANSFLAYAKETLDDLVVSSPSVLA
ncbi:MAG: WcbI family polysaccharide biosynthesis putative acetyltransferase [Synechococcaceae cyanobacterium ELA445]